MRELLPALMVSLALGAPAWGQADLGLPRMGDPADQVLSPAQERELGTEFMRYVASNSKLIDDPLLNDYINALGARIVSASGHTGTGFTFFLVEEPTINAFAAPGGYIGVNSGLVLAAENEAQLAGVLAHETAHVTQRHIARAYAAAQASSLPTAAAIFAAILLGSQNPQAGQAALATGIATSAQRQINFTRDNEYEADRLGIGFLARAGFAPEGMVDFFTLLERRQATAGAPRAEYLSTHPLSTNRVAEARDRAEALREPDQRADSKNFQLVRARLQVLTATNLPALQSRLTADPGATEGADGEARSYELALLAYQQEDYPRAEALLQALCASDPDNLFYAVLRALTELGAGHTAAGLARLDELAELYPNNVPVLLSMADASEGAGRLEAAAAALRSALSIPGSHHARTHRTLARVEDKRGRAVESLESLAEYQWLSGDQRQAVRHLEQALKLVNAGSGAALRIDARLQQLRRQLAEELRQKRG